MSASDHLSPTQFYHGTAHPFSPGDLVETGHVVTSAYNQAGSMDNVGEGGRGLYNHATTARGIAENYAYRAHGKDRWIAGKEGREPHSPKVFQVEFTGDHELDPQDNDSTAYRSRSPMRIVRQLSQADLDDYDARGA